MAQLIDNDFYYSQQAVWPHSGHYRPTEENFKDFISFLKENNVDLTDVKVKIKSLMFFKMISNFFSLIIKNK